MASDEDSRTPYRPVFLHPDEKGSPEASQSIDQPIADRDVKPAPGNYLEYEANLSDLRLLAPYMEELKRRLGDRCHVLQFKAPFTLDGVPNEYKQRDRPLLWKVKTPGATGWVTDQDLKTFYFPSREHALMFIREMRGEQPGTPLEEVLETRDNLKKLLW